VDASTKSAAVAAAVILGGFGLAAYFLPTIMLWVGRYSTAVAGLIAVAFVAAFFLLFWVRGHNQRREGK
jgi:hypothetical protein